MSDLLSVVQQAKGGVRDEQQELLTASASQCKRQYGEGLFTFDGAGNVAGTFNASLNGVPGLNGPYEATYTVSPDCTGVIYWIGNGDTFIFVILTMARRFSQPTSPPPTQ